MPVALPENFGRSLGYKTSQFSRFPIIKRLQTILIFTHIAEA